MQQFLKFVFSPAAQRDVGLAIAACRAGATGIVNAEGMAPGQSLAARLGDMVKAGATGYGVRLPRHALGSLAELLPFVAQGLSCLVVDPEPALENSPPLQALRDAGVRVFVEVLGPEWCSTDFSAHADGIILKGNESGGFVGEDASFILLQKWLGKTDLPLVLRGGVTPAVAAACAAVGLSGVVLDSQLLLLDEAGLPENTRALLSNLSGTETVAVGDSEHGAYYRLLSRPGHAGAKAFAEAGDGRSFAALATLTEGQVGWSDARRQLLPVGHDVCFAGPWRRIYKHLSAILVAIDSAVATGPALALKARSLAADSGLAQALGTRYPIIQGPMTRVSDVAEFASAVANGGALPMVAFALLKGQALDDLLARTTALLGNKPWGIGLLGFAPQALLDEQLAAATRFKPQYAIIAGGRPDQAVQLEGAGIPTFLHVPSANLIGMFMQEGARRFIFEGRECGGHIGPLSSFVLWSTMIDRLLAELATGKVPPGDVQLVFAGGIHDAVSSAIVQVMVAPLVERGVKVGILMGSAYLFTREIVSSGAIVSTFQQEVLDCQHTVNLESGPGHASRCAYTPFAQEFFKARAELRAGKVPAEEGRKVLDDLILGRLRIASKGRARDESGKMQEFDAARQKLDGMYMLGQVATLRHELTDIETLHREVTQDGLDLIAGRLASEGADQVLPAMPTDIAIIGISALLPKANNTREYWQNILDKVDAITEIPSHRWDWRLYFDEDRKAKDKIYSKWGGFLDDMPFDPTRFGMPPKSIEAVDPMQLMALEVAQRTLADSGYDTKAFDREKASVIIGASGGTGDVGTQYGLRAELPRFSGQLPESVADRLPEWTEDSFAGILVNVIAGRIANRLNFGGVNFTTDAACGSSLAAVYQGVSELIAGRSDIVIAGGVDTVQGPFGYLCFSKTQALSPRGRCSTFDASGDGIVISEGIAMVALKRLADAERDGDRVYAVIKGVGGSSDGNAKGMTAPLPAGQLRAMRRAYQQAGFGPSSVGLFEAHGTGTVAGDTAELESTTRLIRERTDAGRIAAIGSVKTMIGHTKATAGIAGLIKAALALHHHVLPPHRGVDKPNAILQDTSAPLFLVDEATPWVAPGDVPRRAACSAFGFGGTNFHVVMEEYSREYRPWVRPMAADRRPAELVVCSGSDVGALIAQLESLRDQLPELADVALRDISASFAAVLQPDMEVAALVVRDHNDLAVKAGVALAHLRGEVKALPPGVHRGSTRPAIGKLAVMFPGQGSQYPGMGREVAVHFGLCTDVLSDADAVLSDAFSSRFGPGVRLSHFIHPRGAYSDAEKAAARQALTSTDVAQPALGVVEVGLFKLMQSFGVQPDMLAGHSYGEFVALHAAQAIGFADLMELSAARGRFIVDAAKAKGAELGTMAAVQAQRKDVDEAIADIDGVIIANHNAPTQSIVSGTRAAVKAAMAKLAATGVDVVELPVAAAFHSSLVKPAQQALGEMIEASDWQRTQVPVYSNSTARPHSSDVARMRRQMAEHLVQPVEFVAEIEAMHADGARIFLEVGPKAVLSRLVGKILEGKPHAAIAVDDGTGVQGLMNALAQLVCAGVPLNLQPLFDRRDCRIGDVSQLSALSRAVVHSKTTWLLNGSVARRATEPVKQTGITLEQAQAEVAAPVSMPVTAATPSAPAPERTPEPPATAVSPVLRPSRQSARPWRKERSMDDRRLPLTADAAVMADYFETMRQFLETQERVMGAFMGDASPRPAMRTMRNATPTLVIPRVPEASVAAPAPAPAPARAMPAPVVAAPVAAAPVPAPAPVRAPAPVAAAPAPAPAPVKAKEAPAASASLGRDKLADILLGIVEDKTGYPRDMVGLDQNLESDLGVDSIKRIEVVGAMLQALPEGYRQALTESRSKLNTQPTLNGMLEIISGANLGAVSVPFDVAEVGEPAAPRGHLPRHVMQAVREPVDASVLRRLRTGHFLITGEGLPLAAEVQRRLLGRGCTVDLIDNRALGSEAGLSAAIAGVLERTPSIAGLFHLAPVFSEKLTPDSAPEAWRVQLQRNDKALFLMLRQLLPAMAADAHVVAASGLGGDFGRAPRAFEGLSLQSGAVGMLKSLLEEQPTLRVKSIDLDTRLAADALADILVNEAELLGGRQEVGFPAGERTVFHTVAAPVGAPSAGSAATDKVVVLATGGARGITAEVLRELARPGNTLVLTGRMALPQAEEADTAVLPDAAALRQHLVAKVRAGELRLTPGDIQRQVQAILARREMRSNLEDFRSRGAAVEYHPVDVTDGQQLQALVADVTARLGAIGGVVHGAGVIEDKRLVDKASDSWDRVVQTKVIGLLQLQRHVPAQGLKFFTVFSSVAGRYGNSGQSDYATANEIMNRLCCQLRDAWQGRVDVSALCWGPWGATQFGAGMVTADTEAKFAEKGVYLVSAGEGRGLFVGELQRPAGEPVELIFGQGPWEAREAELGGFEEPPAAPLLGPLLGRAAVAVKPTGDQSILLKIDASHAYLDHHRIDGTPVLPAAAALEIVAESARTLWPGWTVVEVRDFRLMKGVDFGTSTRELIVAISPPPYGSSEGFEVIAAIQSELPGGKRMNHYKGVVRLEQRLPDSLPGLKRPHAERQVSVAQAYGDWLFHGPTFQVIRRLHGFSAQGSGASVKATAPAEWLPQLEGAAPSWVFDPALLDAGPQMAILWARAFRDETALPARFGRVVRYADALPPELHMEYELLPSTDPSMVRANVHYLDSKGQLLMLIEDLECIASAALNRLGGTASAGATVVA